MTPGSRFRIDPWVTWERERIIWEVLSNNKVISLLLNLKFCLRPTFFSLNCNRYKREIWLNFFFFLLIRIQAAIDFVQVSLFFFLFWIVLVADRRVGGHPLGGTQSLANSSSDSVTPQNGVEKLWAEAFEVVGFLNSGSAANDTSSGKRFSITIIKSSDLTNLGSSVVINVVIAIATMINCYFLSFDFRFLYSSQINF